jgi:hypothetical protein
MRANPAELLTRWVSTLFVANASESSSWYNSYDGALDKPGAQAGSMGVVSEGRRES